MKLGELHPNHWGMGTPACIAYSESGCHIQILRAVFQIQISNPDFKLGFQTWISNPDSGNPDSGNPDSGNPDYLAIPIVYRGYGSPQR